MPFKLMREVIKVTARRLGYVPLAEMAAALAERDKIELELQHKTRNLQSQLVLRAQLEKQIAFLQELELAHARNESGTQQAVDKLDKITSNLLDMMKSVWPEAYNLDAPPEGEAERKEVHAA